MFFIKICFNPSYIHVEVPSCMIDQDVKEFVQASLKKTVDKLGASLNEQLKETVIDPMTRIIEKIKEIETVLNENGGKKSVAQSVFDPSINMLPTHLKTTIGFVFSFITMVDGKKDATEIANRILEEYGTVAGRALLDAMQDAILDSKKNKLKDTIRDVKNVIDGGT